MRNWGAMFGRKAKVRKALDALKNDDEMFAVSYAEYLREHHASPGERLADDAGVRHGLMTYFRELCE